VNGIIHNNDEGKWQHPELTGQLNNLSVIMHKKSEFGLKKSKK
jgi:hypothetical protein